MDKFKVIIVEDVLLELKGTEGILRNEVPEAEIVATADSEESFWREYGKEHPDLVLLDLGLGGSTTVGVEICRKLKSESPEVKVLIFTGEILNEQLWVEALDARCDGIILKTGLLKTLHSKRHSSEIGYLLLGVAQGQMSQKSLVILVNLIVYQSLAVVQLFPYVVAEAVYYLFEYWLVEH